MRERGSYTVVPPLPPCQVCILLSKSHQGQIRGEAGVCHVSILESTAMFAGGAVLHQPGAGLEKQPGCLHCILTPFLCSGPLLLIFGTGDRRLCFTPPAATVSAPTALSFKPPAASNA